MKKSLLVASLAVVSANVFGMSVDRSCDAASRSMRSISQEASTSSNTRKRAFVENDSQQSKRREIEELTDEKILRQTDPEKLEKIETYLGQRKKIENYSLELIKEALVNYCANPKKSVRVIAEEYGIVYSSLRHYISMAKLSKNPTSRKTKEQINKAIAERKKTRSLIKVARNNNMSPCTLMKYVKQQGEELFKNKINEKAILDCYKRGGTFKDIYEIAPSGSQNARKKFAEVIKENMTDKEKESLVYENMDLLTDFREGLLTDKGRIGKYKNRSIRIGNICERNIGEFEDYLIRNIAYKLGYDLSKLSVKWNVAVKSATDCAEGGRDQIINDYNEGLLTSKGLAKKYKTRENVIHSVLKRGMRNLKTVEPRYGSAAAEKMKAKCSNQYIRLNFKQKELFRKILEKNMANRRMPSEDDLNKIKPFKYGDKNVNEKFRKLLLILCNRENELKMQGNSISRLKRELEEWKKLVKSAEINLPLRDLNAASSSQTPMEETFSTSYNQEIGNQLLRKIEKEPLANQVLREFKQKSSNLLNQNLQNVPLYPNDDKLYKAVETLKVYENTTTENEIDTVFLEDGKSLFEKCGYSKYECGNILKRILEYNKLSRRKRKVLNAVVLKRRELDANNIKISGLNENEKLYSLIQEGNQNSEDKPHVAKLNKRFRLILRTILGQKQHNIRKEENVKSLERIEPLSLTWAILTRMNVEKGAKIKSEENSMENSSRVPDNYLASPIP